MARTRIADAQTTEIGAKRAIVIESLHVRRDDDKKYYVIIGCDRDKSTAREGYILVQVEPPKIDDEPVILEDVVEIEFVAGGPRGGHWKMLQKLSGF